LTQKKRRAGFSLLLSFSLKKKEERFLFCIFFAEKEKKTTKGSLHVL